MKRPKITPLKMGKWKNNKKPRAAKTSTKKTIERYTKIIKQSRWRREKWFVLVLYRLFSIWLNTRTIKYFFKEKFMKLRLFFKSFSFAIFQLVTIEKPCHHTITLFSLSRVFPSKSEEESPPNIVFPSISFYQFPIRTFSQHLKCFLLQLKNVLRTNAEMLSRRTLLGQTSKKRQKRNRKKMEIFKTRKNPRQKLLSEFHDENLWQSFGVIFLQNKNVIHLLQKHSEPEAPAKTHFSFCLEKYLQNLTKIFKKDTDRIKFTLT